MEPVESTFIDNQLFTYMGKIDKTTFINGAC